ncbi:HAMP domain-containing histidine kinase [bacterium]|nr:HAMP domain-containing histidine kinase [bacterium]
MSFRQSNKTKFVGRIPVIIFTVIVVICLAQIFWWIYYQVQQNTVLFQLHQAVLSIRVQKAVNELNREYERVVIHNMELHRESIGSRPLESVPEILVSSQHYSTFYCVGDTVFYKDTGGMIVASTIVYGELNKWMSSRHPELTVEQLPRTDPKSVYSYGPSRVLKLPILIRPKTEFLNDLINKTERKTIMFISEGIFFSLMVLLGVYFMFVILKKEIRLESQQKNFILSITHELKSPLASIKLYLQTLLSRPVPPEKQKQFFEHSLYDVDRLERLVENVLEAARLERGEFHFEMKPLVVFDIVNPCIQKIKSYSEDEEIGMTAMLDEKLKVMGDHHALLSVFNNLIENAVKYSVTPKRIVIRLYHDNKDMIFEIEDNGPGIDKNDLTYIFDRFYRAGNELTRNTKGTGIGLYLVKKITEAHQGKIFVNLPESGVGTQFQIKIPLLDNH